MDLKKIRQARDLLNEILNEASDNEGFDLSAFRVGNQIKISWQGEINEIQWKIDNQEDAVSLQKMFQEPGNTYPAITGNEYLIGNTENLHKQFEIIVGKGYWNEETNSFVLEDKETITLPAINEFEPQRKIYGYWDSRLVPDSFPSNVSKGYINQLDELKGDLIPIISGFHKNDTESEIRSRFKGRKGILDEYSDRIKLVILQDEPFYKGFKTEKLEQIVQIGKEVLGDRYKLGYTFADANANLDLPSNIDFAGFNLYILFEEDYDYQFIDTEDKFVKEMNRLLNQAKASIGDTDILVVAQTFSHEGKYRLPEPETALWYANYVQSNPNVIGMLNYRWRYEDGKGLNDLPGLQSKVKKAYEIVSPSNS